MLSFITNEEPGTATGATDTEDKDDSLLPSGRFGSGRGDMRRVFCYSTVREVLK